MPSSKKILQFQKWTTRTRKTRITGTGGHLTRMKMMKTMAVRFNTSGAETERWDVDSHLRCCMHRQLPRVCGGKPDENTTRVDRRVARCGAMVPTLQTPRIRPHTRTLQPASASKGSMLLCCTNRQMDKGIQRMLSKQLRKQLGREPKLLGWRSTLKRAVQSISPMSYLIPISSSFHQMSLLCTHRGFRNRGLGQSSRMIW